MQKFSVVQERSKTSATKSAGQQDCPACGSPVKAVGSVLVCPKCGTKPWEPNAGQPKHPQDR